MGFNVQINGVVYEASQFSVTEDATPLSAGDSFGSVGSFTMTVLAPGVSDRAPSVPDGKLFNARNPATRWIQKDVKLVDDQKGFTLGRIVQVSKRAGDLFDLTCESRLGVLNVFNVQSEPQSGTLDTIFKYYCSLAGVVDGVYVDPAIANRSITVPGFNGELWYNLKALAAALDVDISLVSGVILVRPIRARIAARNRQTESSISVGGSLAQQVEVFYYNNEAITNKLVYPPGGWTEEVPVININAGETIEETLELSSSVTSIQQPTMVSSVAPGYESSSVFTISGDDGNAVPASLWSGLGGSLRLEIGEDYQTLKLIVSAPSGIKNRDGSLIQTYSIAMTADQTGRYSSLRVIGSGVRFRKESILAGTGVDSSRTSTEIGLSIDNKFISTRDEAYRAGLRAARQFTGRSITLSGSVISVNRGGDSGVLDFIPYSSVQTAFNALTYQESKDMLVGQSYNQFMQGMKDSVQNSFANQVFGNVNGARYWDDSTRRWYRVRSANISPTTVSIEAEDDLTHSDFESNLDESPTPVTYGGVKSIATLSSLSYADITLFGTLI